MRNWKSRIKRLQDKTGISAKKDHHIVVMPGEDPDEVIRKYCEEHSVGLDSDFQIVRIVFVPSRRDEGVSEESHQSR